MVRKSEVTILVAIALLALFGCGQAASTKVSSTPAPATGTATATTVTAATTSTASGQPAYTHAEPGDVGTDAPPFKGKTWFTADGKAPDCKNKVCVVEFWSVT